MKINVSKCIKEKDLCLGEDKEVFWDFFVVWMKGFWYWFCGLWLLIFLMFVDFSVSWVMGVVVIRWDLFMVYFLMLNVYMGWFCFLFNFKVIFVCDNVVEFFIFLLIFFINFLMN